MLDNNYIIANCNIIAIAVQDGTHVCGCYCCFGYLVVAMACHVQLRLKSSLCADGTMVLCIHVYSTIINRKCILNDIIVHVCTVVPRR